MKKSILFLMLLSAGIISCNSKTDSTDDPAVVGTDSSIMQQDNTNVAMAPVDTAAAKMKIMAACGIHVVASPADIGKTMAEAMKK